MIIRTVTERASLVMGKIFPYARFISHMSALIEPIRMQEVEVIGNLGVAT